MDVNKNYSISIPQTDSSVRFFPLHKHVFDTNADMYKTPKSRDRKRQEPEAWRERKRARDWITDR